MRKIYFSTLIAFAVCFSFGCDHKKGTDNPNYSTTTEKNGSGEGDELHSDTSSNSNQNVGMENTTDSTKITTGKPGTPVYTSDADFVAEAASGGMLEVALGKVAAQKGVNADVKKFGQHMVNDHSKANSELMALAKKKNWSVPAKMNAEHQATYDKLSQMSGKDFDREYMANMVEDHEKDVAEFEQASQKATDADLKAFSGKTTPILKMHLDMARQTNDKVNDK